MPLRRTSAALLTTACALALAVPAQAGPGKPTVVEYSNCDELGQDAVLCTQARTVMRVTEARSGVVKVRTRYVIRAQLTTPSCSQKQFQTGGAHEVLRQGVSQLLVTRDRLRISGTCYNGEPTDCLQTIKVVVVSGEVKVDRFNFACQPSL